MTFFLISLMQSAHRMKKNRRLLWAAKLFDILGNEGQVVVGLSVVCPLLELSFHPLWAGWQVWPTSIWRRGRERDEVLSIGKIGRSHMGWRSTLFFTPLFPNGDKYPPKGWPMVKWSCWPTTSWLRLKSDLYSHRISFHSLSLSLSLPGRIPTRI